MSWAAGSSVAREKCALQISDLPAPQSRHITVEMVSPLVYQLPLRCECQLGRCEPSWKPWCFPGGKKSDCAWLQAPPRPRSSHPGEKKPESHYISSWPEMSLLHFKHPYPLPAPQGQLFKMKMRDAPRVLRDLWWEGKVLPCGSILWLQKSICLKAPSDTDYTEVKCMIPLGTWYFLKCV